MFFDICFASEPASFRVTKICPRISPDPGVHQKKPLDLIHFFVQSLYLIKMLSSNLEGKRGILPIFFFCSIIERSALARCNVLTHHTKQERTLFRLFVQRPSRHSHHTTPLSTTNGTTQQKNKDTHLHAHVNEHVFVFVCVRVGVRVCVFVYYIHISHEKT